MSIKYMNWVFDHSNTKGIDRLALLALADNANDEGVCWPSLQKIANKCNLSRRHTIRIITKLEEEGHIRSVKRTSEDGVKNLSNVYHIITGPDGDSVGADTRGSDIVVTRVVTDPSLGVVTTMSPKPSVKPSIDPSLKPWAIPPSLDNDPFRSTWGEFVRHRKEIKHPLTDLAGKKLLARLGGYSVPTAIAMLNQSIENGWQGVFELKNGNSHKPAAPRPPQPSPQEILAQLAAFDEVKP